MSLMNPLKKWKNQHYATSRREYCENFGHRGVWHSKDPLIEM